MKREKFLWPLTGDHHKGLVFAKKLKQKTDELKTLPNGQAAQLLADKVSDFFRLELEGHFGEEEAMIKVLHPLLPAGEEASHAQARKVLQDHRELRALTQSGKLADLEAFAGKLTEHIRFEEENFFGTLEKWLGEAEKQKWAEALITRRETLKTAGGEACADL